MIIVGDMHEARTIRTSVRKVCNGAHQWGGGFPQGPPMEILGGTGWKGGGSLMGAKQGSRHSCMCVGVVVCFTWLQGIYAAGGWSE